MQLQWERDGEAMRHARFGGGLFVIKATLDKRIVLRYNLGANTIEIASEIDEVEEAKRIASEFMESLMKGMREFVDSRSADNYDYGQSTE
jgi:uncharacterized protein with von Willebrand factor type A (vWA) domain